MADLGDFLKQQYIKSPNFNTVILEKEGTGGKLSSREKSVSTSWRKPAIALTAGAAAAEEWRRRKEEGLEGKRAD